MKKYLILMMGILFASFLIAGCSSVTKEDVGIAAGGIAGGAAGSALSGGTAVGTIGGAVGGALIGNAVAKNVN